MGKSLPFDWTEDEDQPGRVWFALPAAKSFAGVYRQRDGWWLWGCDSPAGTRTGFEPTRDRAQVKAELAFREIRP